MGDKAFGTEGLQLSDVCKGAIEPPLTDQSGPWQ